MEKHGKLKQEICRQNKARVRKITKEQREKLLKQEGK